MSALLTSTPTLDQFPPELINEVIHQLNSEPLPDTVELLGDQAWKYERLLCATAFQHCVCDRCSPEAEAGNTIGLFPLPIRESVSNLSGTSRQLRTIALDSSRSRSVVHSFYDIERLSASQSEPSVINEKVRNLVVRFNRHEKNPVTSQSGLDFLKLYPNLNSLFIDWHRLIPSTDLTASSSRTSATPQPLVSTTVERLDIRLTDPAAGVENDGLALARQFTGILLRLQLPSLRCLHVIHNLPEKKTFVQENWETVMAGLRSVDFPKLEVLRVSLWLGQRAHSQKYRLWKNALQDLLEHFRAKNQRPKIILSLFYDVSEYADDLTMTPMFETRLRPSLAPDERSMAKFLYEVVEPHPETCEFEIIVHAAPVPERGEGPQRPHEVMVYFSSTDNPQRAGDGSQEVWERFSFTMAIDVSALQRLGMVSYPDMEDPKDLAWWAAYRKIYATVRGNS